MRALAKLWSTVVALVLVAVTSEAWAQGCAMCKASLPGEEDPISQGFNNSIFMFLGVTYSLVVLGGGWIGFRYWRARTPRNEPGMFPFEAAQKEDGL